MSDETKDRFPLLRKLLRALGLSAEAVDDIVERILDLLSAKDESPTQAPSFPYQLRDDFLSPAELSFCLVLRSVVGERAQICPKVALGDLFFAKTGDPRQNRVATNKIDRKHVDFLLCEPKTLRPLLGIELDDKSHAREDRQQRDRFVEGVFAAAQLPLLRVPVKVGYAPSEMEEWLRPFVSAPMKETPELAPAPLPASDLKYAPPVTSAKAPSPAVGVDAMEKPNCPKCGAPMTLRTSKSGSNVGGQFWGCSNFPKCRSIVPV